MLTKTWLISLEYHWTPWFRTKVEQTVTTHNVAVHLTKEQHAWQRSALCSALSPGSEERCEGTFSSLNYLRYNRAHVCGSLL